MIRSQVLLHHPLTEFPTDKHAIDGFRQRFRELFDANVHLIQSTSKSVKGLAACRIELSAAVF